MIGHRSGKRRRFAAVGVATALVAATFGFAGAPVGADDAPGIPDVPPLGFSIDPSQGVVGSTVNGQVDVDDIAANCITDPIAFAEQFVGLGADVNDSPFGRAGVAYLDSIGGQPGLFELMETDPGLFYAFFVASGLMSAIAGDAANPEGLIDGAMEATFIMGFADLATASPISPYGNFDPATGIGSTPVPDLDGGTQVVIATCVGIPEDMTAEQFGAMLRVGADYIEANYDLDDFDLIEAGTEVAFAMLPAAVQPMALGIAGFCVDDGQGSCDEPENGEDPNGNGEEPNGNEPNGNGEGPGGNGNGNGPGGSGGGAQPATPVSGSPTYTG